MKNLHHTFHHRNGASNTASTQRTAVINPPKGSSSIVTRDSTMKDKLYYALPIYLVVLICCLGVMCKFCCTTNIHERS